MMQDAYVHVACLCKRQSRCAERDARSALEIGAISRGWAFRGRVRSSNVKGEEDEQRHRGNAARRVRHVARNVALDDSAFHPCVRRLRGDSP